MLAPGQCKQTDVEFRTVSRAILPIGPLRIRKGDPFGLVRHEKELADRITVFIHPRTVRLDTLNAGVPRDLEGQPSGQIVDDDLDFYGLREYEPGDDVRNVHWLSSAKTGTLMIRQYEATRRTDTSVTISVNPDEYVNGEEFEMAVSIHSSIGVKCLLQDRPLFCHAGNAHGQPRNAMEFLDNASAIEPDREDNPNLAEGTLKHSPDASFYFFTVGSLKDIEQIKRMTLALPRSAGTSSGTYTGTSTTTGSWADSTHSVIWMTRGNVLRGMGLSRQPWGKRIASLVLIAAMMLLAQANLIDVYGGVATWAIAAVPATLLGAIIALAGMLPALRLWWQIVFLAFAQFIIGPVVTLSSTTSHYVIPTLKTLSSGWEMTFGSFKYIISVDPPLGTQDGVLMAVWTIGLWLTFFTGVFAINANAWLSLVGVLPLAAAVAVCALLGTDSGWQRAICGIAFALLLIIWLSWRLELLEWGRWISALIIVVLAAGSGMRSYIKDHKKDVLLTVHNLPAGTPVKLAVMDRFDGTVWNLSDSSEATDSSNYHRVGTTIKADEQGKSFTATFTVDQGLTDTWLPLAGAATGVSFANDADNGNDTFYYNTDTDSAIIPAGTRKGLTYTESGIIARNPTDKQISSAAAARITQPEAQDVPDSASKLATSIAGGQSSGGAAATALADTLKDSGWFSHGLEGDYPSDAGHGNYRINKLLAGTAMVGDSEQYASAMALMARDLGLPSRVVLGFLPKNEDGEITDARTEKTSGNGTKIEFTGNDVTAWVEIKLQGLGWVAFYPTPKETKMPDENQNLTPPNPQTLVRQPPVPLTDPLRDQTQG